MTRPETNHEPRAPFGAPAASCTPFVHERALADCCEPVELLRRVRSSIAGAALFESRARTPHTLVVTRAALRLTLRGAEVEVALLDRDAEPLLDLYAARVEGARRDGDVVRAPVADRAGAAAMLDSERLLLESAFDPLRALAGLVADRAQVTVAAPVPVLVCGAFAFDVVDRFDDLGDRRPDPFDDADVEVVLALDLVRYEPGRGVASVITRGLPWEPMAAVHARRERVLAALAAGPLSGEADAASRPGAMSGRVVEQDDDRFLAGVETLRQHIAAGDVFQAVLSRAVRWRGDVDAIDVFERLAAREPAPYRFHLELQHGALFGASPETCLFVGAGVGAEVEIRPIAGTTLRGGDADVDERLALALLFDEKERAEHVMLLDLARNDVARVAEPGSTQVVQQFAIEKYHRVQHLVSRVRGRLRRGLDALHAYRAAANMGTLSGAPKARASELVRALEPTGRGFYGGAVVALGQDGSLDSCIVIRSVRCKDGVFRAQAGAGVVWHSEPERELEETERKLGAVGEVMASFATATTPDQEAAR